ncbi:hypothetical protein DAPPUDRAFT_116160 [Daphnia pulex]|uniref:Uncharacterized protein n=1 Tax=Daphnia pulex TaxID=6669 RepID=E9HNR9_DAPPU|nr:hypothetical protein DAPPUDRAFT_116160 [Daphnia pulex]|eukprot:EFX66621.1 hypothetical protein DAPPUDRAFT_116160 [Daphnia pulex]
MDSKAAVTIVANGKHIRAYFITNLAITLVRQTIATALGCVLRPVFGPDTSFVDPVTSRDFPILWETRININYSNRSETVVAYVVKDEEIGFPLLAGMDTTLALQGALFVKGNEQTNPLFGTASEHNDLDPRPVLATGLRSSFVSREWAATSEVVATPVEQENFYDPLTHTTLKLYGMVDVQADDDPTFLAFISDIRTSIVLGIDYFEQKDVKLMFPESTISWPQTEIVRPYRPPARSIAGPTCPKCGLNGHVQSQCTGAREF